MHYLTSPSFGDVGDFMQIFFIAIVLAAIDGDGMVVRLSFCNGRVHLKTRFVQTKERVHEQKSNRWPKRLLEIIFKKLRPL